ncbi:MAG: type 2 lantipeptide synthetase LanM family protein [Desulfobacterales bacterium]|nr:type 2 lantipeptide synthetase LanM family protein [Desulfobacterales bacterium]
MFEEIIKKSSTLLERLYFQPYSRDEAFQIIEKWKNAFSKGDIKTFKKRLSWDGLTEEALIDALSSTKEIGKMPEWIEVFKKAIDIFPEAVNMYHNEINPGFFLEKETIVFPELIFSFFKIAKDDLIKKVGNGIKILSEDAWNSICFQLFKEMSGISELALYEYFEIFRNSKKDCSYNDFIGNFFNEGYKKFFLEFSVLARQLCRLAETWSDSYSEFLIRLNNDIEFIEKIFSKDIPLGIISRLETGLSDRHANGRRVIILTFLSGTKIVYKPRDIGQEYTFNAFINFAEKKGLQNIPPSLKILSYKGYGWVEYIKQSSCKSESEIEDYYKKAGVLLGLTYVFCGNDCHMDNVIATEKGPFLIDIESFFQPLTINVVDGIDKTAIDKAKEQIDASVLNTGLLTYSEPDNEGKFHDASGFRGRGGHLCYNKKRQWINPNTAEMTLEYESTKVKSMQNIAMLNGDIKKAEDYGNLIVEGFEESYNFFLKNRNELLSENSFLNNFGNSEVRLIFRPTDHYALFLHAITTPRFQKDGIDASFIIESMARIFQFSPQRPLLWPLFIQERSSLENLDIPRFTVQADKKEIISSSGEIVSGYVSASGIDRVMAKIKSLDNIDLNRQVELIQSILFDVEDDHAKSSGSYGAMKPISYKKTESLSDEDILNYSKFIADQIIERAIKGADGTATWIAPAYIKPEQQSDRGISYYLYDGVCGIALFLASMAKITQESKYSNMAYSACMPVIKAIESGIVNRLIEHESIGVCNGLSSIIYSLAYIYRLLKDDRYLKIAQQIAPLITEERIKNDKRLDIEGGSAGAIIGLLSLYELDNNSAYIEKANICAKHLISKSKLINAYQRGWPNNEGVMLAGMAHGASGIAMALLRLFKVVLDEELLNVAKQVLNYERSLFSEKKLNWPVLHKTSDGQIDSSMFMSAWCHGSAGICLTRLDALDVFKQDELLKEDINNAIENILNFGFAPVDHLCCGNIGRAESLFYAGQVLNAPDISEKARKIITIAIERAKEKGFWGLRLKVWENRCFQPGFFRGLSGIGHSMLRIAYPDLLPSVLNFK